jgi:hypothetical protein
MKTTPSKKALEMAREVICELQTFLWGIDDIDDPIDPQEWERRAVALDEFAAAALQEGPHEPHR